MTEYWQQLQDIFDEVCAASEGSRRALLDERCQENGELRHAVERLLRSYDRERAANTQAQDPPAGSRFGVWETTRLLARGGMGEVWLARRADGEHEQRAALKISLPTWSHPILWSASGASASCLLAWTIRISPASSMAG